MVKPLLNITPVLVQSRKVGLLVASLNQAIPQRVTEDPPMGRSHYDHAVHGAWKTASIAS